MKINKSNIVDNLNISVILTALFVALFSIFKLQNIILVYFIFLFFREIYLLIKKRYKEIIFQIILMIPLIGIVKINGIPLINVYISIFSLYILIVDRSFVKKKNVFIPFFVFISIDFIKFLIFSNNLFGLVEIIKVIVLHFSIYCSLVVYEYISINKDIKLKKYVNYFIYGTLLSMIYGFITRFIESGLEYALINTNIQTRNSGASGDPNYFSLYICLSIAFLFVYRKNKGLKLKNYLLIFIFSFIGMTSSSRMYYFILFVILIIIIYDLIKQLITTNRTKAIFVLLFITMFFIIFKDFIFYNFEYLIIRMTKENDITNGRSTLIYNYLSFANSNLIRLIFGIGISNYNLRSGINLYAHNLYIELLITQGFAGIFSIFIYLIKKFNLIKNFVSSKFLPILVILIGGIGVNFIDVDSFYVLYALIFSVYSETSKLEVQ